MGYKVPDWRKSIGQNMFEVETESGVFLIPKAEYLTGAQAEAFAGSDSSPRAVFDALNDLAPGLGDALIGVPQLYVKEMLREWRAASAVEPGESSASARS